ncbi:hypothetical protein V6N11_033098 [Hibiscus sabdariffa]|uniref:Uncharacterized protein n=1 Tax=Hibiscus sabdariffa TaxID=183260 RepID=A0ABR2A0Z5_9ROSI
MEAMPSCTAQTEEGWFNCLKNECDVELDTEPSTMAVVLVAIFLDIDGKAKSLRGHNKLNVGDRITMDQVQDEDGSSSHYRVEMEQPATCNQDCALPSIAMKSSRGTITSNC